LGICIFLVAGFPLALFGTAQRRDTQGPTAEDLFAQPVRIENSQPIARDKKRAIPLQGWLFDNRKNQFVT
jgi:hypothetical protein